MCFVRCVVGHSLGTSSDNFLWAAGNEIRIRARATDIRERHKKVSAFQVQTHFYSKQFGWEKRKRIQKKDELDEGHGLIKR